MNTKFETIRLIEKMNTQMNKLRKVDSLLICKSNLKQGKCISEEGLIQRRGNKSLRKMLKKFKSNIGHDERNESVYLCVQVKFLLSDYKERRDPPRCNLSGQEFRTMFEEVTNTRTFIIACSKQAEIE